VKAYGSKVEYHFVQEEHENYGAWNFVYPRLKLALKKPIGYYGRAASASTAVGASKIHKEEEKHLLETIFGKK
jgi:2-oxoglutarate dehydrogenase complex dehydrogenase (E1) component-like enzyme